MKKVYRITLWHGDKGSSWTSDEMPRVENGILRFRCQDGMLHWIMGSIEVTEFEQAS